ncbi:MAG: Rho termination factor N-terminal domain-containing protein, partial [Candidatus Nanopelagicales bacterium]
MLLPELKQLAQSLGITGASTMRKSALIEAISAKQSSGRNGSSGNQRPDKSSAPAKADDDAAAADEPRKDTRSNRTDNRSDNRGNDNRGNDNRSNDNRSNDNRQDAYDDDGEGGSRRRRRRGRDRRPGGGFNEQEIEVSEDDVLVPVAGILDILDNYAFVRTAGYLPSPNDVYVSLSMVKKQGLRKGDAITGAVRQPRDGERREKFNPLVRIDTVNGSEVDQTRQRPDFSKLTPLYPQERLRLETEPGNLTTRVIDLVAPIGKGQRGLIVSPPKAGKTMVLQSIANAITENNPECHLMVVLVDERPEEVT